jgi:hypothetical protein
VLSLMRIPIDGTRIWLKSFFGEEEAAIIRGTVISPNKQVDQLVWLGNKNGDLMQCDLVGCSEEQQIRR